MPARATMDDAAALAALDARCFAPGERWSQQLWHEELDAAAQPSTGRLVLVQRDRDIMAAATFSSVFETAELLRVMVDPTHRGLGLARQLVEAGRLWASERGAERMLLEVRHDNLAALRLYEGLGFSSIDTRRDYYGTGLHAVVMQVALNAPNHASDREGAHRV
ncbi:GNAT family N-acetyltransferase [Propionibacteriaceae bacterium G57]|uniref:GNAT family N-acetyltransferase n=1 Tax=Aestuariimicrobium sp. G57 TaxID=3418485 RepID=UPI003DA7397E